MNGFMNDIINDAPAAALRYRADFDGATNIARGAALIIPAGRA